jgi:hypothetical protein
MALGVWALTVTAQKDSSGIYSTATDYRDGKLSYAINYTTEKHKIRDNLIFHGSEIKVSHGGKTYTLKKAEIYGYRDMRGVDYRFLGSRALRVLNKGDRLLLYDYKQATGKGKGGFGLVSEYYFSPDVASAPRPLTKENVKAAYPEDHRFHDALDATFKDDQGLAEYDHFHKMYKIVHLLEAATQH